MSCEDPVGILHWRLDRECRQAGIGRQELIGKLHALDLVGYNSILWNPSRGGPTEALSNLRGTSEALDTEVLILDGASHAFAGNENSRPEVTAFMNAILSLIPRDTGAVICLAHVDKNTAKGVSSTETYSGSTAWHNSVRGRWYLNRDEGMAGDNAKAGVSPDRILELSKSNYGKDGASIRFRWDSDARTFTGFPVKTATKVDIDSRDKHEREAIMLCFDAAWGLDGFVPFSEQCTNNPYRTLMREPAFPDTLAGPTRGRSNEKERFYAHLYTLRKGKSIEVTSVRRNRREVDGYTKPQN